ncbi:hypothetical protein Emag_007238 [Eimeria magna]
MTPAEQRYGTYDQELLALVRALEKWRRLLLVADTTVYTDHKGLEYLLRLKDSKPVRGRVARWLDFLADFTYLKIQYKPGRSNIIADALSRCPQYSLVKTEEPQQSRRCLDPTDKAANQVMVCLNDRDTLTSNALMAADLVPEAVPDPAAAEGSRYYKSIVPEQQHDKPTAYKVKVGGTYWTEAYKTCQDFRDIYAACVDCLSPFEVMIGENPLRASDLDFVDNFDAAISPPMTKLFQQLVDRAAANILRAQAQQEHYADAHRQDVSFEVGDLVWVSTKFMQPRGTRKLQPQFVGPFKVLKRVGKVAYLLNLPPSMQVHPVFHVSLLQRDKPRPPHMLQPPGWRPVVPAAEDEDPVFEVDRLLDSRGSGVNEEFLVKWKGFPAEQATWEPLSNLGGCKDLLRAFWASQRRRKKGQHEPP